MSNDGKYLERLVQIIEQSILPDSIVEHDVWLPILNSPSGEKAQCDIVIRTGTESRQTVTIVEVQDRNKPVEINDFRGWLTKMTAVGAQHLYCVSRKDFPKSVKEQATLGGHTVKLITIRDLDSESIPINFFELTSVFHDIDIPGVKLKQVIIDPNECAALGLNFDQVKVRIDNLKSNDRLFSNDRIELKALSTFCIENTPTDKGNYGTNHLRLGFDRFKPLFLYFNGTFVNIQVILEYSWTFKEVRMMPTVLSYDQNEHGALAWVLELFYHAPRGPLWCKMPVIKNKDGTYGLSGVLLEMPQDTELLFKLENIKKPYVP